MQPIKPPKLCSDPAPVYARTRALKDIHLTNDTSADATATPETVSKPEAKVPTFRQLGLDPKIVKALRDMKYTHPTPIQAQSIPHALKRKDILGIAQTGTGKTGAFVLPVMHSLAKGRARARMPRCLIVCPTRELAAQVAENVELYGKYLKLEMALLIGGVSFAEQDKKLSKGVDILIATPGRLLDQFERGKILLNGVQCLVVDEADRMLDMGFIPDIERIFEITPFTRQVLFFSATMAKELTRIVDTFLHQPVRIEVARENKTADTVTQKIITMPTNDARAKRNALRGAIEQSDVKNGIVFCNRKKDVDIVAASLTKHGHQARPIHGDLPQSERMQTLQDFRDGKLKLLCASDVAARGLDVPDVSHVFNFNVPSHAEDYVHRIGRTGRAGRKGDAVMLVTPLDEKNFDAVKDLIKIDEFEELVLEGVSLAPDVRPGDKERKKRERNSRDRKHSKPRGDRRDRPVAAHGQTASMAPVSKGEPREETPAKRTRTRTKAPAGNVKPDADAKTEAPQSDAPRENRKPREKRPAQKRDDNRAPRPDNKSEAKSEPRADKPRSEKPRRDKPIRNKQAAEGGRKSSRGGLPQNKDTGFGDEMPAFFGNVLKKD